MVGYKQLRFFEAMIGGADPTTGEMRERLGDLGLHLRQGFRRWPANFFNR